MASSDTVVRQRFAVRGIVQGVGFRPFLARLAADLDVAGRCANGTTQVVVEVEGAAATVTEFGRRLRTDAPPLAVVLDIVATLLAPTGQPGFVIDHSAPEPGERTLIPPDVATCAACVAELRNPDNRRYQHPFITCTDCGPRLTIILDLPYDRPLTTMADFPLCAACAVEYADPTDRRYHAQPIACHDCGPTLTVRAAAGEVLATGTADSLAVVRAALLAGSIVAIKGIGGYHLACDAASAAAVATLRTRKHRPDQPFAVMAQNLETATRLAVVGDLEEQLLTGPARPIVLLDQRAQRATWVTEGVAPGLPTLGVMLPYAPVHHLLLDDDLPVLVMTSGNLSGEPLCFTESDAHTRLRDLADLFLDHDRPIAVPCEDSVMTVDAGEPLPLRRSRGYAPVPVVVPTTPQIVLAAGAELKNTAALARDGLAFVSAHVGDLGALESRDAHARTVMQLQRFHERRPDLVVADRHPGYASRAWAQAYAEEQDVPLLEVQHHHAHLAALAAEHGVLDTPLVGLVFDGTGFGCDATIWGGEILVLRDGGAGALRAGHLASLPLPGGDGAVRNPVRMAAAALLTSGLPFTASPHVDAALSADERAALPGIVARGGIQSSSVGRLFDIASSLLGVRHRVTYEGQAAIELEVLAATVSTGPALRLPLVESGEGVLLDTGTLITELVLALRDGVARAALAWAFHDALAAAGAAAAARACATTGTSTVGLTGGVWQNRLLRARTGAHLTAFDLTPLTHRLVPPNDGGISLGQLAVGLATLTRG